MASHRSDDLCVLVRGTFLEVVEGNDCDRRQRCSSAPPLRARRRAEVTENRRGQLRIVQEIIDGTRTLPQAQSRVALPMAVCRADHRWADMHDEDTPSTAASSGSTCARTLLREATVGQATPSTASTPSSNASSAPRRDFAHMMMVHGTTSSTMPAGTPAEGRRGLCGVLGARGGGSADGARRSRLFKGKRDHMKKAIEHVKGLIAENPDRYANRDFYLPALVEEDPILLDRTLAQLAQIARNAYELRGAGVAFPSCGLA